MKLYDMIRMSNSNLWRNKSRTFLTILAIFIGAFTIMMTTGINTGVNNYIDRQVAAVGSEDYLQVMPAQMAEQLESLMSGSNEVREYKPEDNSTTSQILTDEDIAKIESVDGIDSAKFYTMVTTDYVTNGQDGATKYQMNASIMPTASMKLDLAAGSDLDMDNDEAQIVLPDKYVKPLGFASNEDAVGKTIKIGATSQVTQQTDEAEVKIVGVQNAAGGFKLQYSGVNFPGGIWHLRCHKRRNCRLFSGKMRGQKQRFQDCTPSMRKLKQIVRSGF